MKETRVALERAAAVRDAARGWNASGVIDAATEGRIAASFPDPRLRPPWILRALAALLVTVVVLAVFLAFAFSGPGSPEGLGVLCIVIGAACAAAAEAQENSPRLASRGGAGATALWAGVFLVGGSALLAHRPLGLGDSEVVVVLLSVSTVVWAAACLRWGSARSGRSSRQSPSSSYSRGLPPGESSGSFSAQPSPPWRPEASTNASWAPSHRASAAAVQLVALAAAYAGLNPWSVETQWIERLLRGGHEGSPASGGLIAASAAATALLTAAVVAWGLRTRRTLLLDAGIVLTALSLVTLRHYVRIAPLWAILAAAGGALLLLALGLNRWLSRAPSRERGGFTAEPLFADEAKARLLQVIPVAATLGPPLPETSAPADRPFAPGGGSFGGGGASERF